MKTQFKRLFTLSLCLLCFGISSYGQDLTGTWRLKSSKVINGPSYANAVPKQMTIHQTVDKIEFKITIDQGDRDTLMNQILTFKNITENLTKTGKKRLISIQKKNDHSWIKQTEIFLKENPNKRQSIDEENYTVDGSILNLYRKYDADRSTGNEGFTVEASYEKIDPKMLAIGKGVHFTEGLSWEELKAKARTENKYIFVDCYATWCGPCKQMDKEVYPLNSVGEAINGKFISVKVQMDSAKNDSENVRKTYSIARTLEKTYGIVGLPTYLFFSADGEIAHKAMGFQKAEDFISLIKDVQLPGKQLYTEIKACREGKMDVNLAPAFIRRLNDAKENVAALELARSYMKNYLEGLPEARFATKENLQLMWDFQEMSKTDDKIYQLLQEKPEMVNSIYNNPILADLWIGNILNMEYIFPAIKRAQQTKKEPDWKYINATLLKKTTRKQAESILVDAKHLWYCTIKDWDKACDYEILKFQRQDHNKLSSNEIAWELNHIAWTLFTYCFNKKQLEQGLTWVNEAIKLYNNPSPNAMDTKANLLYKLGRKEEAIAVQEKAVTLLESRMSSKKNNTPLHIALDKMKRDEPTWPTSEIGIDRKKQVK